MLEFLANVWKFIWDNKSIILGSGGFFGVIVFIITQVQNKNNKKLDNVKALKCKIEQLEKEKEELQKELNKYQDVEQSKTGDYLILKETGMAICPICWYKEHTPIPIYDNGNGKYGCRNCKTYGVYSFNKVAEYERRCEQANEEYLRNNPII